MTNVLINLVVVLAIALCLWWVIEKFSPDALITKICQAVIFILVLLYAVKVLLPVLG